MLVTRAEEFPPGKWKRRARRFVGPTLNTLHGAEHRGRRQVLQPALDRRRVASFAPSIASRVERTVAEWPEAVPFRVRDSLDPLALEIAGEVLLSTELSLVADRLARDLGRVMAAVPRLTPPVRGSAGRRALAEVNATLVSVLAGRVARPRSDDLLAALVEAGLPSAAIRGEVIAFLLAAVDEPPSALESALYLLGTNPASQSRLHAELDGHQGEVVGSPYLQAVLRETLRLFPPARHIDRCPVHDVHVGGDVVRGGSNVLISPLVTHRDPTVYAAPDDFRPERWLDGSTRDPRGSFVPFGAGAHTCIGEPLATSIMTHGLASIARRWQIRVAADAPWGSRRRLRVTLERR